MCVVGGNLVCAGSLDVPCMLVLPHEEYLAFDREDLAGKEYFVSQKLHVVNQFYNWDAPGIVGVHY